MSIFVQAPRLPARYRQAHRAGKQDRSDPNFRVSEKNKCAGLRRILVRMQGASAKRLSENSNFFQNQGLRKKLPQACS